MTVLYGRPYLSLASFTHNWVNEAHDFYSPGGINGSYILPLAPKSIPAAIDADGFGLKETSGSTYHVLVGPRDSNPSLRFLPVTVGAECSFTFKVPGQPYKITFGHKANIA